MIEMFQILFRTKVVKIRELVEMQESSFWPSGQPEKWKGLILIYASLTQQLLSATLINMSRRQILLSPGVNTTPSDWPHRWRKARHEPLIWQKEADCDGKRWRIGTEDAAEAIKISSVQVKTLLIRLNVFFPSTPYNKWHAHSTRK